MKVALVYDRVNKWGGAERVLLALHELFPDAPLYTSVYDRRKAPWSSVFSVKMSFLQEFPLAKNNHERYPLLMPLAFESFVFDAFDLVISVTSEAAKGIITKPQTKHLCYCLTPTRYLWSGYEEYFSNPLFRFLTKPLVSYLRKWDSIAAQRPDTMIAISKEVQQRVKMYYQRDSDIIYPPVELFSAKTQRKSAITRQNYFLIVSRLVPYKRIDLAIQACNALRLPLKIVGTGSEEMRLKAMAGPSVEFLGNLTDDELIRYYAHSQALLFPGLEDFGITMVEAQSFGKPVIAFRGGGALETIVEGETGLFFSPQTSDALGKVLKQFAKYQFSAQRIKKQAEKFSKEQFKKSFNTIVAKLLKSE